jgi:hypothetical protein
MTSWRRTELPTPAVGPDEARDAAREILDRAEFQPAPRNPLEQVLDWIGDVFGWIFERLGAGGGGGGGGSAIGTLISWIVVLAFIGLVLWLIVRIVAGWDRSGRAKRAPRATVAVRRSTVPDWLAEAEEHERAGRWRDALRARYRLLVAQLADRGLLHEIPGTTTGEERAELAVTSPVTSPLFDEAAHAFDDAWYGGRVVEAADHERFKDLGERVLAGAPQR